LLSFSTRQSGAAAACRSVIARLCWKARLVRRFFGFRNSIRNRAHRIPAMPVQSDFRLNLNLRSVVRAGSFWRLRCHAFSMLVGPALFACRPHCLESLDPPTGRLEAKEHEGNATWLMIASCCGGVYKYQYTLLLHKLRTLRRSKPITMGI